MAPKWLICLFVDSVCLHVNLMAIEGFYHKKSHVGVFNTVFAVLESCKKNMVAFLGLD